MHLICTDSGLHLHGITDHLDTSDIYMGKEIGIYNSITDDDGKIKEMFNVRINLFGLKRRVHSIFRSQQTRTRGMGYWTY